MNRETIDSVIRSLRRVNLQGSFLGQTVAIRFGLSESDVEALEVLLDTGAATAGRLSELMGLTSGAVTRVIDRLEQAGYVRRVPDPADRRRVIVELVPEKMAAVEAAMARFGEKSASEMGRYSDDELAVINDFLTRMAAITRDEANVLRDAPDREGRRPVGIHGPDRRPEPRAPAVQVRRQRAADPWLGRLRRPLPRHVRRAGPAGPPPRRDRDDPVQGPLAMGLARPARRRVAQRRRPVGRRGRRRVEQAPGQARRGRPSVVRADRRGRPASRSTLGRPAGVVPIRLIGGANHARFERPTGVHVQLKLSGGAGRRRVRSPEAGRNGRPHRPRVGRRGRGRLTAS